MSRSKKKTDPLSSVREQLFPAAQEAVMTLRRTMNDEGVSSNLQVDCAKELLNRAFGKSALAVPEGAETAEITVTLAGETDAFSS